MSGSRCLPLRGRTPSFSSLLWGIFFMLCCRFQGPDCKIVESSSGFSQNITILPKDCTNSAPLCCAILKSTTGLFPAFLLPYRPPKQRRKPEGAVCKPDSSGTAAGRELSEYHYGTGQDHSGAGSSGSSCSRCRCQSEQLIRQFKL